jgi:hypothetical protein
MDSCQKIKSKITELTGKYFLWKKVGGVTKMSYYDNEYTHYFSLQAKKGQ